MSFYRKLPTTLKTTATGCLIALSIMQPGYCSARATETEVGNNTKSSTNRLCNSTSITGVDIPSPKMLEKYGLSGVDDKSLFTAKRVNMACSTPVKSVFSGGIVTSDLSAYESTPSGFSFIGKSKASSSAVLLDSCPGWLNRRLKARKCIPITGLENAFYILNDFTGSSILLVVKGTKAKTIITSKHQILDLDYRPSPDATGGNLAMFVKLDSKSGIFLVLQSGV